MEVINGPKGCFPSSISIGFIKIFHYLNLKIIDNMASRLKRSTSNGVIAGVCSGLANYFGWDPAIMRILFVIFALVGVGSPILIYIILWAVMPAS